MSKARDLADFISTGSILSDGTIESTEISGVTATANEINTLDGITATTEELNNVAGVNSDVQTQLDGKQAVVAGVSSTEIGYLDGVTSNLQTQLDNISVTSGSLTKSFANGETASITLAQAISPAPVVSVTKEISQAGQSSKGAWDVNATASNYELHNTAYATTLTPSTTGYDLANASDESKTYSYGGTDNYMQKIAFSTDGTKFYLTGNTNKYVYQYNLTTAWDISTASAGSTFDVSTDLVESISSIAFKTDGSKMYVGAYINDRFVEYDLSTAWDVSTASSPAIFSDSSNLDRAIGMWFKPDGTRFYVSDFGSNHVKRFDLSTAWDITTSSYNSQYSLGSGSWRQLQFKPDGTAMYLLNDDASEDIREYTLSTAWDITTASLSGVEFEYLSEVGDNVPGFYIRTDNGATLYVMDNSPTPSRLRQYSIASSALTLGTGSFASTDVGKRIQGNGGDVTLTSTAGAYSTTGGSAFTDSSTIASGSWTMRGLKSVGDADGIGLNEFLGAGGDLNNSVYTGSSLDPSAPDVSGIYTSEAGTKLFVLDAVNSDILEWTMSTAHDITTATYTSDRIAAGGSENDYRGMTFKPDGTRMFLAGSDFHRIYMYNFNTGFDISAGTSLFGSGTVNGSHEFPGGIALSPDGTKLFHTSGASDQVAEYSLGTPWDFGTNVSFNGSHNVGVNITSPTDVDFNSDGTKMFVLDRTGSRVGIYSLTTPYKIWDPSGVSYDGEVSIASNPSVPKSFSFSDSYENMYIAGDDEVIYKYTTQEVIQPTAQYSLAITNSGGQIDTAFWTDINSMTADQAAGDGTVHYAVSTDDRTTWSVAKASDGVRPIVRDNAGTWQYNSQETVTAVVHDLANATNRQTFNLTQTGEPLGIDFFDNGNKFIVVDNTNNSVFEYSCTTAYDITTASYTNNSYSFGGAISGDPPFVLFNGDGTKMYIGSQTNQLVFTYTLSTAYDITTVTSSTSTNALSSGFSIGGLRFKSDGTKAYSTQSSGNGSVLQWSLSTAYDLSTAVYDNVSFTPTGNSFSSSAGLEGLHFTSDGTKMYLAADNIDTIYLVTLSTAWDLSTATETSFYDEGTVGLDNDYAVQDVYVVPDGTRLITINKVSDNVDQYDIGSSTISYSTSTTWTNATTNDEFYALQQALGATSVNRMDKTQLDAVTDGSHFTLGDTLDLAIALRQDTASASTPKSDGVSINYDAQALNQGAVLGTDYDYDFPDSTTVRVTSNAAQNLKVRVV